MDVPAHGCRPGVQTRSPRLSHPLDEQVSLPSAPVLPTEVVRGGFLALPLFSRVCGSRVPTVRTGLGHITLDYPSAWCPADGASGFSADVGITPQVTGDPFVS